ncbi:MAG: MFS transporter [Desulfuromonadaceae bacterium]|nr:MFS transporter [Desulfuromonadaceae bacterium]
MNNETIALPDVESPSRSAVAQYFYDAKPDNWGLLMAAFSSAYGIGLLAMLVLPFMISSTMNGLHLDEAKAGLLGTVEFVAVTVASLVVAPFMGKIPRRTLAITGAVLAIGGNVLAMFQTSYDVLILLRPIVGIGCGLALAAGNATVANAKNPEKLAGQMSVIFVVLMVVAMVSFAHVSEKWGYAGVYGALAICMLVVSVFLVKLPQKAIIVPLASPDHPHAHQGLFSKSAIFMLIAMFAFALRDTMMWAYSERIGLVAGYAPETLGNLFSIQAVIGIVGPLIASVTGSRYGLRKPVILGIVLTGIVTFTILQSSNAMIPYTIGVLFISVTYFYALSYLTALAAELDTEGRVVAASGGFLTAGVAAGPAVSGYLIVHGGYALSSWINVGIVVMTLILISVPLTSLRHKAKHMAKLEA